MPYHSSRMVWAAALVLLVGCGTTRWSDTTRTGVEQLLVSNAIDQAVAEIDFTPMRGRRVFVRADAVNGMSDHQYLTMVIRQSLAASGGVLCDTLEEADYVVEIRAGAIGTDRNDMLIGVPAVTIPAVPGVASGGSVIPEVPFVKRTHQRGVAKVAVFAYNRRTGLPVWASGNNHSESTAKALWVAGAGPVTKGTIYDGVRIADHTVPWKLSSKKGDPLVGSEAVVFAEPEQVRVAAPPQQAYSPPPSWNAPR
ncbi:MAG: DUF6655 family protein [Thermoguttaceae bacterium]